VIELTRLDGSPIVVNADVIAWLEPTPDTVVCLLNGEKLLVRETPAELVARAVAYRRRLSDLPGLSTSVDPETHTASRMGEAGEPGVVGPAKGLA
jgi:flagellar protein FlbD